MNSSNDIPWFAWAVLSLMVLSLVYHYAVAWQRRRILPQLAKSLGLTPWGDGSTPGDLSLQDSSLNPIERTFNVFSGTSHSVAVCFFDVAKRKSKGTSYFTVIAARALDPFGAEVFDPDLHTEKVGAWTLLYSSRSLFFGRRFLSAKEIEAQIQSVTQRHN